MFSDDVPNNRGRDIALVDVLNGGIVCMRKTQLPKETFLQDA